MDIDGPFSSMIYLSKIFQNDVFSVAMYRYRRAPRIPAVRRMVRLAHVGSQILDHHSLDRRLPHRAHLILESIMIFLMGYPLFIQYSENHQVN